jgi:hypothetical protein
MSLWNFKPLSDQGVLGIDAWWSKTTNTVLVVVNQSITVDALIIFKPHHTGLQSKTTMPNNLFFVLQVQVLCFESLQFLVGWVFLVFLSRNIIETETSTDSTSPLSLWKREFMGHVSLLTSNKHKCQVCCFCNILLIWVLYSGFW